MIQSTAPSVSSSLSLSTGTQAGQGDDAAVSADFAALLNSTRTPGKPGAGDGARDPEAAPAPSTGALLRQDGKEAGNPLPSGLPDAEALLAELATLDAAGAPPAAGADAAAPGLPTATPKTAIPGIVLALLAKPLTAAEPVETPQPAEKSTAASLALVVAAQLPRATRTATDTTAARSGAAKPAEARQDEAGSDETGEPADVAAAAAIPVDGPTIEMAAIVPAAGAAPIQATAQAPARPRASATATATAAATVDLPKTPVVAAPLVQAPAQPQADAALQQAAARAAPGEAATPAPRAPVAPPAASAILQVALGTKPAAATGAPAPAATAAGKPTAASPSVTDAVSVQAAASERPASPATQKRDTASDTPDTRAPAALPATLTAAVETDRSAASTTAPAAADAPRAELPALAAATPQPIPTVVDTASIPQAVDTAVTAPSAAVVHQAGHDFATLVDRLVEAREAATPQTVHAAVSHAEFGQVSLRFDQDASGLSVAMTSADPDFARAVQASAPSAGAQTMSDNGANPSRQDAQSQQQTASAFSGQPQSQAQSQTSARNDRSAPAQNDTRTGASPADQGQDDDGADARGGIYA